MWKLTTAFIFLTFYGNAQPFPVVKDTIVSEGLLNTRVMMEGGFDLIAVSNDFTSFDIAKAEQLNQQHLYRRLNFIFENGEPEVGTEDVTFEPYEEQPTEQPPPPPPITIFEKDFTLGNHFKVRVDFTQLVSKPDYSEYMFADPHGGETFREMYESEITFLSKYYKPPKKIVDAYPVLIENISDTVRNVETLEGWIFILQEAKDKEGNWRPIEYIDYRAVCGNSHGNEKILPDEYLISKIYRYNGNFQTKLRVRFSTHKEVYFSNEYDGWINYSQFEIPEYLYEMSDNLNENFLTN
ncbi:MAG: hypothetical protein RLO17_06865 [Cyclobacteriaceae bacterium]